MVRTYKCLDGRVKMLVDLHLLGAQSFDSRYMLSRAGSGEGRAGRGPGRERAGPGEDRAGREPVNCDSGEETLLFGFIVLMSLLRLR